MNDLYFFDFNSYRNNTADIKFLPKEIQIIRYEHFEKARRDLLMRSKEQRNRLIQNNYLAPLASSIQMNEDKKSFNSKVTVYIKKNRSKSYDFFNNNNSSLGSEMKAIEKIKERQKKEINKLIDYEIKMEIMKKENEEKLMKQRVKEEKLKNELLLKQKHQEDLRKKREMEKELLLKREFEENERKKREQELQEQKKIIFNFEKEKQKKIEKAKKELKEKEKQEEFKAISEKNFLIHQERLKEKQKIMIEREEVRNKNLDSKKEELQKYNKQMQEIHEKKLILTRMNLENKINIQKEVYYVLHRNSKGNKN
jgi:hypothetical protein